MLSGGRSVEGLKCEERWVEGNMKKQGSNETQEPGWPDMLYTYPLLRGQHWMAHEGLDVGARSPRWAQAPEWY